LDLEEWLRVVDKVEAFAKKLRIEPKLYICGGEPITSSHLLPISKAWIKKFPNSARSILTNGTLLKKPMAGTNTDYASGLHQLGFEFQISVDGPDESTHDKIRGRGNFLRTMEAIERLNSVGARYNVLSVLTDDSSKKIRNFFELASERRFQRMDFERVVTVGAGESASDISGSELKRVYEAILFYSRKYKIHTNTRGPLWAAIDPVLGSADSLGFYDWIIGYKGNLKISSRSDYSIGHVLRDDPYDLLMGHPVLKKLRRRNIDGCSQCRIFKKGKCSGNRNIAFAKTGSFFSKDPGCWLSPEIDAKNEKNFNWIRNFFDLKFNNRIGKNALERV